MNIPYEILSKTNIFLAIMCGFAVSKSEWYYAITSGLVLVANFIAMIKCDS